MQGIYGSREVVILVRPQQIYMAEPQARQRNDNARKYVSTQVFTRRTLEPRKCRIAVPGGMITPDENPANN